MKTQQEWILGYLGDALSSQDRLKVEEWIRGDEGFARSFIETELAFEEEMTRERRTCPLRIKQAIDARLDAGDTEVSFGGPVRGADDHPGETVVHRFYQAAWFGWSGWAAAACLGVIILYGFSGSERGGVGRSGGIPGNQLEAAVMVFEVGITQEVGQGQETERLRQVIYVDDPADAMPMAEMIAESMWGQGKTFVSGIGKKAGFLVLDVGGQQGFVVVPQREPLWQDRETRPSAFWLAGGRRDSARMIGEFPESESGWKGGVYYFKLDPEHFIRGDATRWRPFVTMNSRPR